MEYSIENVEWMHLGAKFAVGCISMFMYALFKYKDKANAFDFGNLLKENKPFWNWAVILSLIHI